MRILLLLMTFVVSVRAEINLQAVDCEEWKPQAMTCHTSGDETSIDYKKLIEEVQEGGGDFDSLNDSPLFKRAISAIWHSVYSVPAGTKEYSDMVKRHASAAVFKAVLVWLRNDGSTKTGSEDVADIYLVCKGLKDVIGREGDADGVIGRYVERKGATSANTYGKVSEHEHWMYKVTWGLHH